MFHQRSIPLVSNRYHYTKGYRYPLVYHQKMKLMIKDKNVVQNDEVCRASCGAVRDTLYVLSGKWKLPIIISLKGGPKRFKELHRLLDDITPKILSKELKELEMNDFVTRTVYSTSPVTVEYELTKYSHSLDNIIDAMRDWGLKHRKRIMKK